ncbi:MAG TPA: hypothetical protein ENH11_02160 [Candidatus Acetothermia bacterium]|nr:hypothetical protein [Candidatus Acetothermia bacterium]
MKLLITVPTYWRPRVETRTGIYDHPTPIGEEGTLPRLLDSLVSVASAAPVAVIAAVTDPVVEEAAASKVRTMIEPYRGKLPIALFSRSEMESIAARFSALGYTTDGIGLIGYGSVRNLQLVIGTILGVDAVIGLDDDEEVGLGYLRQVHRFIGEKYEEVPILGVVGPYREAATMPINDSNPFLERGKWIRDGISALEIAGKRLVETSIGFGGNMVIHRDLFNRVPFDPHISRGEDIDYITTCRMHGHKFWWNRDLFVRHFPPDRFRRPPCAMLRADIARFIYSREKIAVAVSRGLLAPGDLDPYPGRFLREDLVQQSLRALHKVCPEEESAQAFVDSTVLRARDAASEYFRFQAQWEALMERIGADKQLSNYVRHKFDI